MGVRSKIPSVRTFFFRSAVLFMFWVSSSFYPTELRSDPGARGPTRIALPPIASPVDSLAPTPLSSLLYYLEDPRGRLDIQAAARVLDGKSPGRVRSRTRGLSLGYSDSVYWFAFTLRNKTQRRHWRLDIPNHLLNYVTLYYRDTRAGATQEFVKLEGGVSRPMSERHIKRPGVIFGLEVDSGETKTYYIRIKTNNSLRASMFIRTPEGLDRNFEQTKLFYGLFFGLLITMGLYNLFLYLIMRDETYLLYVAYVFSLILFQTASVGVADEYFFPESPHFTTIFLIHGGALAIFFSAWFARKFLNLREYGGFFDKAILLSMVVSGFHFISPLVWNHSIGVRVASVNAFCLALLIMGGALSALWRGYKPARYFLFAWSVLLLGTLSYTLGRTGLIRASFLVEYGLHIGAAIEVVFLSFALGDRFNTLLEEKDRVRRESYARQLELTESFARFVPSQFIKYLNKRDITEVQLGDAVQTNMTVLFCDIRDFTSLSESMAPRENFEFLNAFWGRLGPVVRKNGGFIDKYMGDAVMALFPESADQALAAGLEMRGALAKYNEGRRRKDRREIRIGIGINTGGLIIGAMGDQARLEGTVIADAVNLASRLEESTKTYGITTLISGETLGALSHPEQVLYRRLGLIRVKGKRREVDVYEVFDGDEDGKRELKTITREVFERGVELALQGDETSARACFEEVLSLHPDDRAAGRLMEDIRRVGPDTD